MPPKNYKKITNSKHLRQVLSNVINQLLNDEMDSQIANSIATLASTMLKIIRATELEDRIKRLEDQQKSNTEDSSTTITSDIDQRIKDIKTGEYRKCGT